MLKCEHCTYGRIIAQMRADRLYAGRFILVELDTTHERDPRYAVWWQDAGDETLYGGQFFGSLIAARKAFIDRVSLDHELEVAS